MAKAFQKERFIAILRFLKPFATVAIILIILRATGLMASITSVTNQALLKTGLNDFEIDDSSLAEPSFDYNFSIKSMENKIVKMEELKGKVIFLNLWATWCGPCRAEMPGIQQLYNRIDKTNIEFVMLSIDRPGSERKIKKYIDDQAHTFPVYVPQSYLPKQLNVPSIPTTFIIDKSGKIVSKKVGMTNFDTSKFEKYLEGLAAE